MPPTAVESNGGSRLDDPNAAGSACGAADTGAAMGHVGAATVEASMTAVAVVVVTATEFAMPSGTGK